jgi:hypothetical protein
MGVDLGPGRDRRRVSGSKLKTSAEGCGGLTGIDDQGASLGLFSPRPNPLPKAITCTVASNKQDD